MLLAIFLVLLQIIAGLLYGNLIEYLSHKYVLHGLGKSKENFFAFHWHEHHKKSRKQNFYDNDYESKIWDWNARGKEALALFILWLAHAWLFWFIPVFALVVTYCAINYYFTHKKSHLNPGWAKVHLRHHWEHHMGRNQDVNFGVTKPWCDWIFGTRVHYREVLSSSGKKKLIAVK